jgi:hypothetical protein
MKKTITFILFGVFLLASSCKNNQENNEEAIVVAPAVEQSLAQKVSERAGIKNWYNVSRIDFTFNVESNGNNRSERAWSWQPKENIVRLISKNDTIVYSRGMQLDSLSLSADRAFVNDVYWLLPQFKLEWDAGTSITYPDENVVSISYGNEGGYTPGDRYDMEVNEDNQITSWDYYPAGFSSPRMTTSFENYQNFNGLELATEHRNPEGTLNIKFTDVKVYRDDNL